jgi:prolyl-tRNA editing enzyme YbaK/EbsC (Cys-tRNA(Pro) deacylase)
VQRVIDAGEALGLSVEPRNFPAGAKTAVDAAAAIGCEVGQVVNSLIFGLDDDLVLAYVSGENLHDEAKLATAAGGTSCRASQTTAGLHRPRPDAVRLGMGRRRNVERRVSAIAQ